MAIERLNLNTVPTGEENAAPSFLCIRTQPSIATHSHTIRRSDIRVDMYI